MTNDSGIASTKASNTCRIFAETETNKISQESLSFILVLEQANVLNAIQRELVLDRAMALAQPEVKLEETRWIVLMALWNQGKAKDYLFVEDAVFSDTKPILH